MATVSLVQACKEGLSVTPSLSSLPFGWTQQFRATSIDGSKVAVSWAVNGVIGGSPVFGTISRAGLYAAPDVPPSPATVTITAVSRKDSKVTATALVQFTGLFAYVSNQSSGTLSAFGIDANGSLIPIAGFPIAAGKTPFFLAADARGSHLYVTDLAESAVYAYSINPRSGALAPMDSRAIVGSGPRSLAIDPSGKMLYVACTDGAGIYGFSIDVPSGTLAPLAGSPFRNLGLRPAAITLDPSGQFAFVPNNASKNVSVFRVNSKTGQLTSTAAPYASGTAPVWANTDKSGTHLYVLSDVDDAIYSYSVATTGTLSKLSTPTFHGVADPLSSTLSPNGDFLYVPNWSSSGTFPANSVSVFSIDPPTGKLTPITGSPFATGAGPTSIAFEPSGKFAYVVNELAGTVSEFSVNSWNGAMRARPVVAKAGGSPTTIAIVATKP